MIKNLSLKSKILLCTFIPISLLLVVVGIFHNTSSKLNDEDIPLIVNTKNLKINELEMRKNEKNALMNDFKNKNYFKTNISESQNNHKKIYNQIIADLEKLKIDSRSLLIQKRVDSVLPLLKEYKLNLDNVFKKYTEIGFEDYGKEGQLRRAVHEMEAFANQNNNQTLKNIILMLRRHEKDFMLRRNIKYKDIFNKTTEELNQFINSSDINDDDKMNLIELSNKYNKAFNELVDANIEIGLSEDEGVRKKFKEVIVKAEPIMADIGVIVQNIITENQKEQKNIIILTLNVSFVAIIITLLGALYMIRSITKPLNKLRETSKRVVGGEVDVIFDYDSKDEIGELTKLLDGMAKNMQNQAFVISKIAEGDMSVDIEPRSEKDIVNIKLKELLRINNEAFAEIKNSAEQVETASLQIASGSQLLSHASMQQASNIDEVTSSISIVSKQSEKNAQNSTLANQHAVKAKTKAIEGTQKMNEMITAMQEINEASLNISKIIKVIDEIAFQTNILSLNAAVEAARAGQHGKGFAVVAEEVRNLAVRSAEAAKETTELIEQGIDSTKKGASIANETSKSLNEIRRITEEVVTVITGISTSSNEQALAINQISQAIEQVSSVVQNNSSTAQESAASSQELSSQATLLKELVARFKIKEEADKNSDLQNIF